MAAAFCVATTAGAACGRDWSFLETGPTTDGGPDATAEGGGQHDAATADAVDAPPCSIDAPFGTPTALAALNTGYDEAQATLTPDELTIYFGRGIYTTSFFSVYVATRSGRDAGFAAAVAVPNVNDPDAAVQGATITGDGKTLYLDSYATGARHITVSTATGGVFTVPVLVPELVAPEGEDGMPYVLPAGSVLYFSSFAYYRGGGDGGFDIYRAQKDGTGDFGAPTSVPGVNDPAAHFDGYPVVTSDELTIYLGSARAKGGYDTDIYVASRPDTDFAFSSPTLVNELWTEAGTNYPMWLSPDRCRLYFASNRPYDGGNGSVDLWVAERSP